MKKIGEMKREMERLMVCMEVRMEGCNQTINKQRRESEDDEKNGADEEMCRGNSECECKGED